MSRTRQLAAIMFTDIQGYTALMQEDEQKALQARDKHRRIFNRATEKHRGRILQYYGDGTLSIFDSAIEAVNCAIEMQLGFLEAPNIPVRIGIHSGEIAFSEEEIIGDSVNVASRVESLAVAGSILISGKVYDDIKNQAAIKVSRLRTFRLKNVKKPVELFAIANEGLVVPEAEELQGKTEAEAPGDTFDPSKLRPGGLPFLATKLFIPPARPEAVRRSRLLSRIDAGLAGKMTLISAPAGFGKTTLVSEWIAIAGRPAAWLSLDEEDSDPVRFLTYLLIALRSLDENFGAGPLQMLQSPQLPPSETIITALLNELSAKPREWVLVLDDYHVIDSQGVDQAMTLLLDYLPPGIHLLMTTREDPKLPLARLRARNQLTEFRASDLRFTANEAAGFLNEVMGLQLKPEDISALENRTEGWIAGLQMAALSLQGRDDTAQFIREFTGSHRFVLDYLAGEVLQRQPSHIHRFLLDTAILDRLCGPLCDVVTGRSDSQATLEALERSNLFIVPLDDRRHWYRYHHLFADVLRARSSQASIEALPSLHQRASRWFEANGFQAEAIRHSLAAGDHAQAAALIEMIWPQMDGTFQTTTWMRWVKALPQELVQVRPVILAGIAWSLLGEGKLEAGEARIEEVEKWFNDKSPPPPEMVVVDHEQFRFLPSSMAIARAYHAQAIGDVPATAAFARQALQLLPEENHILHGQAASLLGLSYWAVGKLEDAYLALKDTMQHFRLVGNVSFAISVTYGMADILITQGQLRAAATIYEASLRKVKEQASPLFPGIAELYMGLGDLAREHGELDKAAQYLQKSEEMGAQAGLPNWKHRQCVAEARLKEAQGDLAGALECLDEAERSYFRSPIPEVQPIAARRARLLVRHRKLEAARSWAREQQLSVEDELSFAREFEHITLASLLIAENSGDSLQKAIAFLAKLRQAAEAGGRMGNVIDILLQEALALAALGNSPEALARLEQALKLGEPEGYLRTFIDEGTPMGQLLSKATRQELMPSYVNRLLSAFPGTEVYRDTENKSMRPSSLSSQPLIEPLSQRELEILQLIAEGLSNQEISRRLFIALSTVKGHNQKIFGKLDVQRRTEAVARARDLGII